MCSRSSKQTLTVAQREAIRSLAREEENFHFNTFRALVRRGLAQSLTGRWSLTEAGEQAYHEIMASGDGPEALKELMRF